MNASMHTCVHARMCTHKHTLQTHTHIRTERGYRHACFTHTHTHTHTPIDTHTHACAHTHTHTHTPIDTHTHACAHTHTHTHTDTYAHFKESDPKRGLLLTGYASLIRDSLVCYRWVCLQCFSVRIREGSTHHGGCRTDVLSACHQSSHHGDDEKVQQGTQRCLQHLPVLSEGEERIQ